jgi:hypothetical protein
MAAILLMLFFPRAFLIDACAVTWQYLVERKWRRIKNYHAEIKVSLSHVLSMGVSAHVH